MFLVSSDLTCKKKICIIYYFKFLYRLSSGLSRFCHELENFCLIKSTTAVITI